MRFARTFVLAFLSLLLAFPVLAQQAGTSTPQRDPQAVALLQKSLAALTGGHSITDITLSGTARRIPGSDEESGTAVLKALASGATRIDFSLPSGLRSEIANLTTAPPAGTWSGPDGISHAVAFHNLLSEPSWFFPAFAIARRLSNPRLPAGANYIAEHVGRETLHGQTVEHISVSQTPPSPDSAGKILQHLTQVEFFLDSTTFLPTAITFNIHPDNDAGVDLPVEVRFSDYRIVNGSQIPFHVQRFLNDSLLLDFQAQTVSPNSDLSAADFQVQ